MYPGRRRRERETKLAPRVIGQTAGKSRSPASHYPISPRVREQVVILINPHLQLGRKGQKSENFLENLYRSRSYLIFSWSTSSLTRPLRLKSTQRREKCTRCGDCLWGRWMSSSRRKIQAEVPRSSRRSSMSLSSLPTLPHHHLPSRNMSSKHRKTFCRVFPSAVWRHSEMDGYGTGTLFPLIHWTFGWLSGKRFRNLPGPRYY